MIFIPTCLCLGLPLVLSNAYNEGRYNQPYSGGDWNERMRGMAERDMYNDRTQWNPFKSNRSSGGGNGGGNGGGGSFIGALIMIVVMIAIIVPTAISALISSLLLITVAKKIFPSLKGLPFKPAFKACFAAILLHAVVFSIAYWISSKIMIALKEKPDEQSIEAMQQYLSPTLSTNEIYVIIGLQVLCLLLAARSLYKNLSVEFEGSWGYVRAVAVTATMIAPVIIGMGFLTTWVLKEYVFPMI